MNAAEFDVAVIGSGPAGALAAWKLSELGRRVLMLDVGHDDDRYRKLVPDLPFAEIRRSDRQQRRYFLGDDFEGVPRGQVKVGAQLTPPRQYVTAGADEHLPYSGEGFDPMQSLALGGLGAAWGAASFTYSDDELRRIGIFEPDFRRYYDAVARLVGISAEPGDDASQYCFAGVREHLPPLDLDSASADVWERYGQRRDDFLARGLSLGRTPLAVLSRDHAGRSANPYFDMDFWGDSRKSVFRPRYLVEELTRRPNFTLERDNLVTRFEDDGAAGVRIHRRALAGGVSSPLRARRLLLCAGAIGSARIALNSLERVDAPVPLLCNPYTYMPCVNWRVLGGAATDRKHSMSQLTAIYRPADAPEDCVPIQFYGYRSLLLFKLVKEMPLPPWAGLAVSRILANSLLIGGLHHSDEPTPEKTLRIRAIARDSLPEIRFDYRRSAAEVEKRRRLERVVAGLLRRLGLIPLLRIDPGPASSIHYAGTVPIADPGAPWGAAASGRMYAAPNVFVGDSASWRFLPAKGLTFTIMANAVRVAEHLDRDLEGQC